jgi:hypothetical protein
MSGDIPPVTGSYDNTWHTPVGVARPDGSSWAGRRLTCGELRPIGSEPYDQIYLHSLVESQLENW